MCAAECLHCGHSRHACNKWCCCVRLHQLGLNWQDVSTPCESLSFNPISIKPHIHRQECGVFRRGAHQAALGDIILAFDCKTFGSVTLCEAFQAYLSVVACNSNCSIPWLLHLNLNSDPTLTPQGRATSCFAGCLYNSELLLLSTENSPMWLMTNALVDRWRYIALCRSQGQQVFWY